MNILVIIPAYNEATVIPSVIGSLKRHGYDNILVVDDGSNDGTAEAAERLGVYVARHLMNRGVGSASATGFEIAKILDPEIIVTFDGDGQHDAADIVKLVEPIRKDEADVAIGSRMRANSGMPLRRVIYNRIANIVTFVMYGFSISDTQSGLKAFSRKAFRLIDIETSKMEFCSEIVYKIKKNGLRFKEVEVRTIYTDYSLSKGQSLINGFKTLTRLMLNKILRR